MITLKINNVNLYRELGIVLEEFDIGIPEKKINKIDVPGRNGELDMSRALTGRIHFHNRIITVVLGLLGSESEREEKRSRLFNMSYHEPIKIEFSHLDGYFMGDITFQSYERTPAKSTIKATIDCYPFRYANTTDNITYHISNSQNVQVNNTGMPVLLTIYSSTTGNVEFKGKRMSLKGGTIKTDWLLDTGINHLKFMLDKTGSIDLRFRKEML